MITSLRIQIRHSSVAIAIQLRLRQYELYEMRHSWLKGHVHEFPRVWG